MGQQCAVARRAAADIVTHVQKPDRAIKLDRLVQRRFNVHEVPKFIVKMSRKWFHRWSQNAGANDLMAKDEELMAARNTLGLEAFELAGYEKTFGSYKELPDGRPGYALSRYPFPLMKANEGMDWQEWILPMIGADGERGIKAFSAN